MRGVIAILAWIMSAGAAFGAPPASLEEVMVWVNRDLTDAGELPILGFSDLGVTFGSPKGITIWDNGLVEGDIRQEFFEPVELDGEVMRSSAGHWTVDCARQRYAVLRITLYARNDLKGQLSEREIEPPIWIARNKVSQHVIDGMCRAARTGARPDQPAARP